MSSRCSSPFLTCASKFSHAFCVKKDIICCVVVNSLFQIEPWHTISHHFFHYIKAECWRKISNHICEIIFSGLLMAFLDPKCKCSRHWIFQQCSKRGTHYLRMFVQTCSVYLCPHSDYLLGLAWGKSMCHIGAGKTCLPLQTLVCAGFPGSPVTLVSVPI